MATQNESGREVFYRLEVTEPTTVRAMVFDRGSVDVDLHLLDATASASGCIERNDKLIVRMLTPGTYYFVVDTFVTGGVENAGEYLFVVLRE